jgi:hypothetical protein
MHHLHGLDKVSRQGPAPQELQATGTNSRPLTCKLTPQTENNCICSFHGCNLAQRLWGLLVIPTRPLLTTVAETASLRKVNAN